MELPHGILHFPSHPFDVDVILAINDIRLEEKYTFTYWVIYIIGFSLIQHKEFRFIYPIHPILLYFTARGYVKFKPKFVLLGILLNICIGLFFTNVHERGVIDLTKYLATQQTPSVGFITPCHSTPWQSYFHNPNLDTNSWFLACEPPLHLNKPSMEEIRHYRDQSDQFYDAPELFCKLIW